MRGRIIFWFVVVAFLVTVVAVWASVNDKITDHFALDDMRGDIAAMQFEPDPAPKKSGVETLQNPRIVTLTKERRTYNAVVMNVLVGGCSVLLERRRDETSYRLEGDEQRKIEVYTPVSVWHDFTAIDLMPYESQAEASGPGEIEKFLQSAVPKGAALPCLRSSGDGAPTGPHPTLVMSLLKHKPPARVTRRFL